jgi:hypothetical protein
MCISQFTVTVSPITSAYGTDRAEQATTFLCLNVFGQYKYNLTGQLLITTGELRLVLLAVL